MSVAQIYPSPGLTIIVLLTLVVICAASWIMFRTLVARSTSWRESVVLSEWARDHGMRVRSETLALPPPFDKAKSALPAIRRYLSGRRGILLQLQADRDVSPIARRWNVLICPGKRQWPPTGLRPTVHERSVLDLFSLTSFPLLGPTERFIVYGTDSSAAQKLSRSSARGLLPPDVGLLMHGSQLVLDFSARPFDEVEFNRMLSLAGQLAKHLTIEPAVAGR